MDRKEKRPAHEVALRKLEGALEALERRAGTVEGDRVNFALEFLEEIIVPEKHLEEVERRLLLLLQQRWANSFLDTKLAELARQLASEKVAPA